MDNYSKAIQWNCRSVNSKKSDLIHIINKYHPTIVCLQETWLKPESIFKIQGYSCIREDRSDGYGGVAILVKHPFPFSHVNISSHDKNFSIIAIIVNNICFVSIYIPHPSFQILKEVKNILESLPKPILVLGDFNAQHQSWGSSNNNNYGHEVLDIVDSLNLCILNNCTPTRRTNINEGKSAPDLSISSPSLASSLIWQTLNSTYGSDHFPILINLPFKNFNKTKTSFRIKYQLASADWDLYKATLDNKISTLSILSQGDEYLSAEAFAHAIIETANEVFPSKKPSTNNIPLPPWWDSECSRAVKKRKEAELNYNLLSSEENFEILNNAIITTKKLFKRKKWEGWKRFCETISPEVKPSFVWQNIKRFRSAFKNSSPNLPSTMSDQFLDILAPSFVPQPELIYSPISTLRIAHENTFINNVNIVNDIGDSLTNSTGYNCNSTSDVLNAPFTLPELKGVLTNVKDSTPGKDGIMYSFFTHMSDTCLLYFLNILNSVMESGKIPPQWKEQEIIPILKPNKPADNPSSYRPIALSSVVLKIAEHLVKNRLEWFIESNKLLSENQFGFRRGRSTIDSLAIFTTDIRLAFSNNNSVLAAFLDISSAYDNVSLPILKHKLNQLKVPVVLINFILNILLERSITLRDSNEPARIVWKGIPQGSVLSPILYNIYTYDLEYSLGNDVKVLQYADDLLIYNINKSIDNAKFTLDSSLHQLKNWLFQNNLELTPSKSTIVLFSRCRLPPPVVIKYNNIIIPVKNNVKFLGVYLDSRLTGVPHMEYVVAKCERLLNIIRCLSGVWWGAHPLSLKLIYNAIIRSVLDYGTFLIEPGSSSGFTKMNSIQAKALRIITGAMKTTPINALQVECCEPPLQLRRQYLADKFFFRFVQNSNHPLFNKLKLLSEIVNTSAFWRHKALPCLIISFRKFMSIQSPVYRCPSLPLFSCSFESLTISPNVCLNLGINSNIVSANYEFNSMIDNHFQDWHRIYTDASKHTSHVGIGVYHEQFNIVQKIKFPPESSVFTGECYGILKALEYILLMKLEKTLILSDSKSALMAIQRYPFQSKHMYPVIFNIRTALHNCVLRGYVVMFAWIPGHVGIVGNVLADRLANEAVVCGDIHPYINYCHDLTTLPRLYLKETWEEAWETSGRIKGKFFKSLQPNIPSKPWFSSLRFGKQVTSSIIRMRLGHVCTPIHLARFNIIESDLCACGDVGDLNHIFFVCPLNDVFSFYNHLVSIRVPFPTSIKSLLSCSNPDIYTALSIYLLNNNLKL